MPSIIGVDHYHLYKISKTVNSFAQHELTTDKFILTSITCMPKFIASRI